MAATKNNANRNAIVIVGIVLGVSLLFVIIAAASGSGKPASTYNTTSDAPDVHSGDAANTSAFGSATNEPVDIGYEETAGTSVNLAAERDGLEAAAGRYFEGVYNRASSTNPEQIYDERRLAWEVIRHLDADTRRAYERDFKTVEADIRLSIHRECREDRAKRTADARIESFDLIRVEPIDGRPEAITYWRAFNLNGWMIRIVLWMIRSDSGEWLVYDTLWVDSNAHTSRQFAVWYDPALDNPAVFQRISRKFDAMEADFDRLDRNIASVSLATLDGYMRDRDLKAWHATIEMYRLDVLWMQADEDPSVQPKLRAEFERLLTNRHIGPYVHRQYGIWLAIYTTENERAAELMEVYYNKFGPDDELNRWLGLAYLWCDNQDKAREIWQQWIDTSRNVGQCHSVMLENRLFYDEDCAAAVALYKSMMENGGEAHALDSLDYVLMNANIDGASVVALVDATSLETLPTSGLWLYALGMNQAGRADEAIRALRPMLRGGDAERLSAMIGALVELGAESDLLEAIERDSQLKSAVDTAQYARLLLAAGRNDDARTQIHRGLGIKRNDESAVRQLLAMLLYDLDDAADALDRIKQLERLSPEVARAIWDVKAEALAADGREDEAVTLASSVATDARRDEVAQADALYWLESNRHWAALLNAAETLAEREMTDWCAAFLAVALVAADRVDDAVPVYRGLVALYDASFWRRDAAIHALLDLGQPGVVIDALRSARVNADTGVTPERLEIWRAYAMAAQGKGNEAADLIARTYADTDEPDYYDRSAMFSILLEHGQAATALRLILELPDDTRDIYTDALAEAYARMGNLDKAAELLPIVEDDAYTSYSNAVALASLCMRAGDVARGARAIESVGAQFGQEEASAAWWTCRVELAYLNDDLPTAMALVADWRAAYPESIASGLYFARSSQPGAREIWEHAELGGVLREWYVDVTKREFRMPASGGR